MKFQTNYLCTIFFLFFSTFSSAQCDFNLDVQVVKQATCPANGVVQVTLSGDDIDLNTVLISLNSTNGLINEVSSVNGIEFTGLPPYTYNVSVRTVCKSTRSEVSKTMNGVIVNSEYDMLNAVAGAERRKSLACFNSGSISFDIRDGLQPYSVCFEEMPALYSGETTFEYSMEGMQNIGSLAAGNYVLYITDVCQSSIPLTLTVEQLASDFPSDPFAANTSAVNGSCDGAAVSYNVLSPTNDLSHYWNNRSTYYDVAFTTDTSVKDYLPVSDVSATTQNFTLPQSYRSVRASGKPVEVWLRLKGTACEQKVDALQLGAPPAINFSINNVIQPGACNTFEAQFRSTDIKTSRAACPPYRWELRNSAGDLVDSANDVVDFPASATADDAQQSTGLQVNTDYTFTMFDSEGFQIVTRAVRYNTTVPSFASKRLLAKACRDYSLTYSLNGTTCFPVTREIFDENGTLLSTETLAAHNAITALEYDLTYNIVLTDAAGNVVSFTHNEPYLQTIIRSTVYQCDDYNMIFRPELFCDKYEWTLTTANGVIVLQSSSPVAVNRSSTVSGLKYDTAYILKVYNADRTLIEDINISRAIPQWSGTSSYGDRQCADYQYNFGVQDIYCFPYRWEIYDSAAKLVRNGTGTSSTQTHNARLPYNKEFILKVFDTKGVMVLESETITDNAPPARTYITDVFAATPCYDDEFQYKGYMYIQSADGGIDVGATIRFVSGPQRPRHDNVTFTTRGNYFYPFSTDYSQAEETVIADGDYVFEINDPCGAKQNVTISFKNSTLEARGFSYIKDDESDFCNGVSRLYPQGYLYENGSKIAGNTYFHLLETPSGEVPIGSNYIIATTTETEPYSDSDDFFSFTQSGKYVIGISSSATLPCMLGTLVIDHTRKSLELEGRSSYVCSDGGNGHIIIVAKNGREPYSYELQTTDGKPVPVAGNPTSTGIFEFGAEGDNYKVSITDACNKSFPIDIQINSIDQIPFSTGVDNVNAGDDVHLSCLLIGAQSYEWFGPDGFVAHSRQATIPDVTAANAGEYTIRVKPLGCDDFIEKKHYVNVKYTQEENITICAEQLPYTFRDIVFPVGTISDDYIFERKTKYNNCDSTVVVKLTVHQINYDTENGKICKGNGYDLQTSIINKANTDVRFYSLPNETGEGISPVVSPVSTTTYYVRANNPMGCKLDRTIKVVVADKPAVGSIPVTKSICEGDVIDINPPPVTDNGASVTGLWLLNGQAFDINEPVSYDNNRQSLQYIAENICGTASSNEMLLDVQQHPVLERSEYEICYGDFVELQAPASDAYLWLPINSTEQNPVVNPTETSYYSLVLANNVCRSAYTIKVVVFPLPEEVIIRQNGLGQISIDGGKDYKYQLDEQVPTYNTLFKSLASGYHILEISNTHGCTVSQTFFVRNLIIPPYFSPNGDGLKDEWEIENFSLFPGAKISVYNREGKMLEILDENNPAWNGRYNGRDMPSTDYWYLLEVPEFKETNTGHFTLKR